MFKHSGEVANYLHGFAALRSGIARAEKWNPEDSRQCDEKELRRRVRWVLDHTSDSAHWANESFKDLATWALRFGVVSEDELHTTAVRHGRAVAS